VTQLSQFAACDGVAATSLGEKAITAEGKPLLILRDLGHPSCAFSKTRYAAGPAGDPFLGVDVLSQWDYHGRVSLGMFVDVVEWRGVELVSNYGEISRTATGDAPLPRIGVPATPPVPAPQPTRLMTCVWI
jgi:hypothetical protein